MTIVIAGGSGFIGTALSKRLTTLGYTVIVVDVVAPSIVHEQLFFVKCDITASPLPYGILEKADAVINLAGKSIAGKWTPEVKKAIHTSRVESTKHIVEEIGRVENRPSCFICASAIGFYGDTAEEIVDEQFPQGEGFLAGVVGAWESEARKATEYGVRVVCVRTAPVLGKGGMLSQLKKMARFGFLLKLKKRDIWMSWIHEEDIVNTYIFALQTTTVQGVFNAAAPNPVQQSEFFRILGKVLHRRVIGTIPRFITKRFFGESFTETTKSQRVAPKRLLDKGFEFSYPTLEEALRQIFK